MRNLTFAYRGATPPFQPVALMYTNYRKMANDNNDNNGTPKVPDEGEVYSLKYGTEFSKPKVNLKMNVVLIPRISFKYLSFSGPEHVPLPPESAEAEEPTPMGKLPMLPQKLTTKSNIRSLPPPLPHPTSTCMSSTGHTEEGRVTPVNWEEEEEKEDRKRPRSPCVEPVEFSDSGVNSTDEEGGGVLKATRKRLKSLGESVLTRSNCKSVTRDEPNNVQIELRSLLVAMVTGGNARKFFCCGSRAFNFKIFPAFVVYTSPVEGEEDKLLESEAEADSTMVAEEPAKKKKKKRVRNPAYLERRKVAQRLNRQTKRRAAAQTRDGGSSRTGPNPGGDESSGRPQVKGRKQATPSAEGGARSQPPRKQGATTAKAEGAPSKPKKPRYQGKCVFVGRRSGSMSETDRRLVLTTIAMGLTAVPGPSTDVEPVSVDLQGVLLTNSGHVAINTPNPGHQALVARILADLGPEFVVTTDFRSMRRFRFGLPGYMVEIGAERAMRLILNQNPTLTAENFRPVGMDRGTGERPHPSMTIEVTEEGQAQLEALSYTLRTLTVTVVVRPLTRH